MKVNADVYRPEHLNADDKAEYEKLSDSISKLLNPAVTDEFVSQKDVGGTMKKLYSDIAEEFTAFLKEQAEYLRVDFLLEKIDSYSEEEFAENCRKAKLNAV